MSAAAPSACLGIAGVNTRPLHTATLRIAGAQDGTDRQHGSSTPGAPPAAGARLGDRAATACWAHAAYLLDYGYVVCRDRDTGRLRWRTGSAALYAPEHRRLPVHRSLPGVADGLPELRSKPWHQGSQDHPVPNGIWQARLPSPRLRRCPCRYDGQASASLLVGPLPEHTAPELRYLESKWACLVSYGLTVKALGEFLPVHATLNTSSVRRDALSVGGRLETELGPEPDFPLTGCAGQCVILASAPEPITVGIDGGYLRDWDDKHAHFVAIVGAAVPADGPVKRFGFVQSHDPRPGSRLAAVLSSQGLQHHQELVFLSDGEEGLRQLQCYLRPHSSHVLDWFHLSKRLVGVGQCLKGLAHLDAERTAELQEALECGGRLSRLYQAFMA